MSIIERGLIPTDEEAAKLRHVLLDGVVRVREA